MGSWQDLVLLLLLLEIWNGILVGSVNASSDGEDLGWGLGGTQYCLSHFAKGPDPSFRLGFWPWWLLIPELTPPYMEDATETTQDHPACHGEEIIPAPTLVPSPWQWPQARVMSPGTAGSRRRRLGCPT